MMENKRYEISANGKGRRILILHTLVEVDKEPEIHAADFDAVWIDQVHPLYEMNRLTIWAAAPMISEKSLYKPLFVNSLLEGKLGASSVLVDGYADRPDDWQMEKDIEVIYDELDRLQMSHLEIEMSREELFYIRLCRYMISRRQYTLGSELVNHSEMGYASVYSELFEQLMHLKPTQRMSFHQRLLEREYIEESRFVDKVHLCPHCMDSHLLFIERCPRCGSSHIREEEVLHHFRCANVSPESTYQYDGQLRCPKCRQFLRHIGVDYDRPASVYTCVDCGNNFLQPQMKVSCTKCKQVSDPEQLVPYDVREYVFTEKGIRAMISDEVVLAIKKDLFTGYSDFYNFTDTLRLAAIQQEETKGEVLLVVKLWTSAANGEWLHFHQGTLVVQSLFRDYYNYLISTEGRFAYLACWVSSGKLEEKVHELNTRLEQTINEWDTTLKRNYRFRHEVCSFRYGENMEDFVKYLSVVPA